MKSMGRMTAAIAACGVVSWMGVAQAGDAACAGGACSASGSAPAVAASATLAAPEAKPAEINTAGLAALLKAKTPVVLLDARAAKWDDGKRIPGAKAVNADSADSDISAAAPDKNGLVVTYCAGVKCPASGQLAAKLRAAGYANVIEYREGIAGWVAGGNSVEEAKK